MRVSEKSLELNVGAEVLMLLRGPWGMRKAYLRGLTQREEHQEGVDFIAQLGPRTRIFAFQFKAPKGRREGEPYRFTIQRRQHEKLSELAGGYTGNVFYVLPYYVSPDKLQDDVPNLLSDTWLLEVGSMNGTSLSARIGPGPCVAKRGSRPSIPSTGSGGHWRWSRVKGLPSDASSGGMRTSTREPMSKRFLADAKIRGWCGDCEWPSCSQVSSAVRDDQFPGAAFKEEIERTWRVRDFIALGLDAW